MASHERKVQFNQHDVYYSWSSIIRKAIASLRLKPSIRTTIMLLVLTTINYKEAIKVFPSFYFLSCSCFALWLVVKLPPLSEIVVGVFATSPRPSPFLFSGHWLILWVLVRLLWDKWLRVFLFSQAKHRLDPLPPGWFYNGSNYVSLTGEKEFHHPRILWMSHYLLCLFFFINTNHFFFFLKI